MISKLLKKIISLSLMSTFLISLTSCVENKAPAKISDSKENNVTDKIVDSSSSNTSYTNVKYPTKDETKTYKNQDTVNSINRFASITSYNIFSENKSSENNLNYSPISLFYTLSLLSSGANGKTEQELMSLLGFEGKDKEYLSEESNKLFKSLYKNDDEAKILIANSLWAQNGLKYNQEYIDNAQKNFYASLFNIDFSKQDDMNKMSEWVKENTNNKINPAFSPDTSTVFSAVNAIYFKSTWTQEFDSKNNYNDKFYISDDKTVECEYMKTSFKNYKYFVGKNYTSAYLNMKNSSMYFVLPDKNTNVYDLVSSEDGLKEIIDYISKPVNGKNVQMTFNLPKFTIKSTLDLEQILKQSGCSSMFSDADFSGISNEKLAVSSIKQENFIEVNEKGAEAAAYSSSKMEIISLPPSTKVNFKLDRPYIYILTASNGTVLFVGICNNPTID